MLNLVKKKEAEKRTKALIQKTRVAFLMLSKICKSKLNLNINKTNIYYISQECVRQFVFLGITIQETLNWDRYIDKIATKIYRTLGVMNKLKHFLPKYTLKIMYRSLMAPHFNNKNYCGALINIGS